MKKIKNTKKTFRKNKKGQVQMGESIVILIILIILIVIGMVFYFNIRKSSVSRQQSETFYAKSISIAEAVTSMPELACSINGEIKKNCIDFYKMKAFSNLILEESFSDYYYEFLGYSTIWVEEIFPIPDEQERTFIYNSTIEDFETTTEYQIPILVFKGGVGAKQYSFGVIYIRTYD